MDAMLERESERTGITSLKIASNNVFGYYIDVECVGGQRFTKKGNVTLFK